MSGVSTETCYGFLRWYPHQCHEGPCIENATGYEHGLDKFIYNTYDECCGVGIGMKCVGPMPGAGAGDCWAISSWYPFNCGSSADLGTDKCSEVHPDTKQVYQFASKELCCAENPTGAGCAPSDTDTCWGISDWYPFECDSGACNSKNSDTNQLYTHATKEECCYTAGAGCSSDLAAAAAAAAAGSASTGDGSGICSDAADFNVNDGQTEYHECHEYPLIDMAAAAPAAKADCEDDIVSRKVYDVYKKSFGRHSFSLDRKYDVDITVGTEVEQRQFNTIIEIQDIKAPDMKIVVALPVSSCPAGTEIDREFCARIGTEVFGSDHYSEYSRADRQKGCIAAPGEGVSYNHHSSGTAWDLAAGDLEANGASNYFTLCAWTFEEGDEGTPETDNHIGVLGASMELASLDTSKYIDDISDLAVPGGYEASNITSTWPRPFAYHSVDNCAESQPHSAAIDHELSNSGSVGGSFTIRDYTGNTRKSTLTVQLKSGTGSGAVGESWQPNFGSIN